MRSVILGAGKKIIGACSAVTNGLDYLCLLLCKYAVSFFDNTLCEILKTTRGHFATCRTEIARSAFFVYFGIGFTKDKPAMKIIFFLLLVLPAVTFAQKIYSPKGKEIKLPKDVNTPDKIFLYLRPAGIRPYNYRVEGYDDDTLATVAFQLFSDLPLFVSCTHPERIKDYIDQFNLDSYFLSPLFEAEVRKHIAYRDLTAIYITDKLGEPDAKTKDENGDIITETYDYTKCNCTLIITNGIVTNFLTVKANDQGQ